MFSGSFAKLAKDNGELIAAPPVFLHTTSEFVNGGIKNGLEIACLDEWKDKCGPIVASRNDEVVGEDPAQFKKATPRLLSIIYRKHA